MRRCLDLRHLGRLARRASREADVVARLVSEQVAFADLLLVDAQLLGQHFEDHEPRGVRGFGVSGEQGFLLKDRRRPRSGHLGVLYDHVVFADVEELRRVGRAGFVGVGGADSLVSIMSKC